MLTALLSMAQDHRNIIYAFHSKTIRYVPVSTTPNANNAPILTFYIQLPHKTVGQVTLHQTVIGSGGHFADGFMSVIGSTYSMEDDRTLHPAPHTYISILVVCSDHIRIIIV